jgi:hypothetical protein
MQDSLISNLDKLKKSKSSFSLGEQSQIVKIICAQIVILKSNTNSSNSETNKLIGIY